jgi:hypothetical protein
MKTKVGSPRFDAEGYQKNIADLNGEPLPELRRLRVLSRQGVGKLGLPSPDELAGTLPQTKITLAVDDDALEFFKREAKKRKTSYQRMIRNLLSHYARVRQISTK